MKDILREIRSGNILLEVVDGELKVYAQSEGIDSQLLGKIRENKEELKQLLTNNADNADSGGSRGGTAIPCAPESESYPLSSSQYRLWLLCQQQEANVAYNVPGVKFFEGDLRPELFERALRALIARHEILRTVFRQDRSGAVRQYILPADVLSFALTISDVSGKDDPEKEIGELMREAFHQPFDLQQGPLLRASLHRVSGSRWVFIYALHHIVSDGWSRNILVSELWRLYNAYIIGNVDPLPALRIQYKDYAVWQQQSAEGPALNSHKAYWEKQLGGDIPVLDLPSAKTRPVVRTYNGAELFANLYAGDTAGLKAFMQEEGVSLFIYLVAAVKLLLHRYTGEEDIVIGTPVAGREHVDLEDQIGFFANTLALRTNVCAADTFRQLLQKVKRTATAAYTHAQYPFDRLVQELKVRPRAGRNPLFDVMVVAREDAGPIKEQADAISPFGVDEPGETGKATTVFDLVFSFALRQDGLYLRLVYNTDIYEEDMIQRLAGHCGQLIRAVMSRPDRSISRIEVLSAAERSQQLEAFNHVQWALPAPDTDGAVPESTLISLFDKQVTRTPDNTAVYADGKAITFYMLQKRAHQLAVYLAETCDMDKVGYIGIMIDRSIDMIIAMLGVLKAGCAFVPIDPTYPRSRQEFIITDSGLQVLLADEKYLPGLEHFTHTLLSFQRVTEPQVEYMIGNAIRMKTIQANDPAYVIYTSGSTGEPNGVITGHAAIANSIVAQHAIFRLTPEDRCLQFLSPSFDASIFELFIALTTGAALYIVGDQSRIDLQVMERFMQEHAITFATLPPSYFRLLPFQRLPALKKVVTGGEPVSRDTVNAFCRQGTYFNSYGPTEASVTSTVYVVDHGSVLPQGSVPIGKPITHVRIYVLDEEKNLLPLGATGEIYIGGKGLASGYHDRPELNACKLLPDPYRPGERVYRTGDLAKWTSEGLLVFAGRKDNQVKLRGYRIELEEIERRLLAGPGVQMACTAIRDQGAGPELTAWLKLDEHGNIDMIRRSLQESLPHYMVPGRYYRVDQWPISPNGKTDRKRILEIKVDDLQPLPAEDLPVSAMEEELLRHFRRLLNMPVLGTKDDFFAVGGHSLAAMQLVNTLNQSPSAGLAIRDLYEHPTVARLADFLSLPAGERKTVEQPVDLNAETRPAIDLPDLSSLPSFSRVPKNIFLTGGTGFVGAYLLHKLLLATDARIFCLVRADDAATARKRLVDNLGYYGLYDASLADRITAVPGDMAKLRLGIEPELYGHIADSTDFIYHTAAYMDLMATYRQSKTANVGSARAIAELAVQSKLKKVVYVSTLSVFASRGARVCEETDSTEAERHLQRSGYAASKWVAENLLTAARSRGLPLQIFRLGLTTGDKITARLPTDQWYSKLLRSCYTLGYYPKYRVPVTPVDYIAEAIVALSLKKEEGPGVFHLHNEQPVDLGEIFTEVCGIDKVLREIDLPDWARMVMDFSKHTPLPIGSLVEFWSRRIGFEPAAASTAAKDPPGATDTRSPANGDERPGPTGCRCGHTRHALEALRIQFPDLREYIHLYLSGSLEKK